jgi:hypothetical protein
MVRTYTPFPVGGLVVLSVLFVVRCVSHDVGKGGEHPPQYVT